MASTKRKRRAPSKPLQNTSYYAFPKDRKRLSSEIYTTSNTTAPFTSTTSNVSINPTVIRPVGINEQCPKETIGSTPVQNTKLLVLMPPPMNFSYVTRPISNKNPTSPITLMTSSSLLSNTLQSTPMVLKNTPLNSFVNQTTPLNSFVNQTTPPIRPMSNPLPINQNVLLNYSSAINSGLHKLPGNMVGVPIINVNTGNGTKKYVILPQSNTFTATTLPHSTVTKTVAATQAEVTSPFPPGYKNPFDYSKLITGTPRVRELSTSQSKLAKSQPTFGRWACIMCSEVKESKESLIEHYELHKKEKENPASKTINDYDFECPICFEHFNSSDLYKKHARVVHGENEFVCQICKLSYSEAYKLSMHNFNKHPTASKMLTCCVCKVYTCLYPEQLKNHISMYHKQEKLYRCTICEKTSSSLTWLTEHSLFHVNPIDVECKICKRTFSHNRFLVAHNKEHHMESISSVIKHKCDECDLHFADKRALLYHMRSHSTEESLCFICGKIFGDDKKLNIHLKIHEGVKNHMCNECGKSFLRRGTLITHLRTHSGERPHTCLTCGKTFSQRSPLVIHQRHHTGDKPYVCPRCNKGYVSKSALGIHRRTCKA